MAQPRISTLRVRRTILRKQLLEFLLADCDRCADCLRTMSFGRSLSARPLRVRRGGIPLLICAKCHGRSQSSDSLIDGEAGRVEYMPSPEELAATAAALREEHFRSMRSREPDVPPAGPRREARTRAT